MVSNGGMVLGLLGFTRHALAQAACTLLPWDILLRNFFSNCGKYTEDAQQGTNLTIIHISRRWTGGFTLIGVELQRRSDLGLQVYNLYMYGCAILQRTIYDSNFHFFLPTS